MPNRDSKTLRRAVLARLDGKWRDAVLREIGTRKTRGMDEESRAPLLRTIGKIDALVVVHNARREGG